MPRAFRTLSPSEPPPAADDAFLPEAEVFPAETPIRHPTIPEGATDEDSESLFLPEAPSAVDRAESSPLRSFFGYDPDPILDRGPVPAASEPAVPGVPAVPAVLDAWPLPSPHRLQRGPSLWGWTIAAAVLLLVLASAVIFSGRLITRQGVVPDEPRVGLAPTPSPTPLPLPDQAPVVESPPTPAVIPPTIRSAEDESRTPPPAAALPAPTRPAPTVPVTKEPVPAAPAALIAQENVAPPSPSLVSVNAPPPLPPVAPPVARVEPPTGASSVAPSAPPPAPAPAPAPETAPAARASETASVEAVLTLYRSAFETLDVNAVEAIWPSVNTRALGNAFNQLETQTVDFDDCRIDVNGPRANAACSGTARFVPKVGSKRLRVESRRWTFQLARAGNTWIIERVESR